MFKEVAPSHFLTKLFSLNSFLPRITQIGTDGFLIIRVYPCDPWFNSGFKFD